MRHMLYVITAQVLTSRDGYSGSVQVPTFYLDSAIQGIVNAKHAADIAATIIDPLGIYELSIHAEPEITIHAEPAPVMVPGPAEPAAFVPPF